MNSLPPGFRALVFGASGAIGGAFVEALRASPRCAEVVALARQPEAGGLALDLEDEATIAAAAQTLRGRAPFHLMLCATGALHVPDGQGLRAPEKRLAEIDPATMARAFALNSIGPALLLKHFHELLAVKERALFAALSARVGSIGDNRLGGWYSYRASKAALNMILRTAAVEVARKRPLAVLAALHPGTVRSRLSAPFVAAGSGSDAGSGKRLLEPADAAAHLLAVLDALPAEGASGSFHAWDGAPVPW